MIYRVAHRFTRVEAMGSHGGLGRANDPADPISLMVKITDAVDVGNVIETATTVRPTSAAAADPLNIITQLPEVDIPATSGRLPYRAATGLWTYDLTPELYQAGKQYNVSWRYEMTPGNLRVEHTAFTWNPPQKQARDSSHCVVSDTCLDLTGTPQSLKTVTIEKYEDTLALNNRIDSVDVQTDIFGNWYIELPRKAIVRILINSRPRIIAVPDTYNVVLSQIPDLQPKDVRKDAFGYPL